MQSYHVNKKTGKLVPCKTTPCSIKAHRGTDIIAENIDDAYEKYYAQSESDSMKESIINSAVRKAVADPDTSDEAQWLEHKLSTILDGSTVTKENPDDEKLYYTNGRQIDRNKNLILDALTYAKDAPGGSRSDYIADHVSDSLTGSDVKLSENFNAKQVFDDITENAIHPNSELGKYIYLGNCLSDIGMSSIRNYEEPIPNDWSLVKPETINSVATDKDGNTYRLLPYRENNGDLGIMAVNELGQSICDMSLDRTYLNNKSKSLEAIKRGYGLTKPLKHVDNSIYIDEASVSGLQLDKSGGKITGSYMMNTPQGQKHIYRYQFKDDVESVATRNTGYADANDVVRMMKGEDITQHQLPENWNNMTHEEHTDFWKTKTPYETSEIIKESSCIVWEKNNIHGFSGANYQEEQNEVISLESAELKNKLDGLECNRTRYQNIFNLLEDDNYHTSCAAFERVINPTD